MKKEFDISALAEKASKIALLATDKAEECFINNTCKTPFPKLEENMEANGTNSLNSSLMKALDQKKDL